MADTTPSESALTFSFPSYQLRTLMRNGEPWFVAADVCAALGISRTDDGVSRLDEDEKGAGSIRTPGGDQQVTIVNESGLYSLILGSRKPEAKRFKRWVTGEVLPAIRRTGRFDGAPAQALALVDGLQHQVRDLRASVAERDTVIALKDQAITGLQSHLVGALGKHVRLLERVTHMQHRHSRREAVRLAVDMERRGEPRDRILVATGLNANYLRQIVFRARAAGDLPAPPTGLAAHLADAAARQTELNLGGAHGR